MRNRRTINKKLIIGIVILLGCFAAIAVTAGLYERQQQNKMQESSRQSKESSEKEQKLSGTDDQWAGDNTLLIGDDLYGYDHRIETWLFIGTDNSGNEAGTGEEYHGAMADFLLLMVVDHTANQYGFLQIDRNTMHEIPLLDEEGDEIDEKVMQLCTAHWYGTDPQNSAENTVDVVADFLGELDHIDGYYVLNMNQIGTLNHLVGGVDVAFEEDLTDLDPAFQKGQTITLSDAQAEAFIRARMSLRDDSNAYRMERQRTYMNAYIRKAIAQVKASPNFANRLWETLHDAAVTDMTGNDFSRIAETLRKDENLGILKLDGDSKLGEALNDGEEHEEFYPSEESLLDSLTRLFSLERLETDDPEDADDDITEWE